MNPTVGRIDLQKLAQQNLKYLSAIEREIFDFKINNGSLGVINKILRDNPSALYGL